MILDIILGANIDTILWIKKLKENMAEHIVVLDYDYYGEPTIRDGVLHFSVFDLKNYVRQFDTINVYKSIYVYPVLNELNPI